LVEQFLSNRANRYTYADTHLTIGHWRMFGNMKALTRLMLWNGVEWTQDQGSVFVADAISLCRGLSCM